MRGKARRRFYRTVIVLAAVTAFVAALATWIGGWGSSAAEQWIADQIQSIAGHYLEPRLTIGQFHYQYPRTVVLDDCRLEATEAGETVDILSVRHFTLELAEIPRKNVPIKIERVIMDKPTLRLVTKDRSDGRLFGFSNFLRRDDPGADVPSDAVKLSDLFQMRWIQIMAGTVVYDPRLSASTPMVLDQISFSSKINPHRPGTYAVRTELNREHVFFLNIEGIFDLDEIAIELQELSLNLTLNRERDYLPPQVQKFLSDHEIRGELNGRATGRLTSRDWADSTLEILVDLDDGNLSVDRYQFPVDKIRSHFAINARRLIVRQFDISALAGEVHATGRIALNSDAQCELKLKADDLQIENLINASTDQVSDKPQYGGRLTANIALSGPLSKLHAEASGTGELHLRDGMIVQDPIISPLTQVLNKAIKITKSDVTSNGSDRADLEFDLEGDHIHFTSIRVVGSWYALRGQGRVYFDDELDLRFNAGPLEKLQGNIGKLGKIVGVVTDSLTKYTVTGTLQDPKIGVKLAARSGTKSRKPKGRDGTNAQ